MVPLSLAVGRWFQDRQGLALGLAAAGSGVSTVFAPSIVTALMEGRGIQAAFYWEGLFILALSAVVWLLVRNSPAELGLEPYRQGNLQAAAPVVKAHRPVPCQARRMGLLLAALLVGGMGGPGFSHLMVLYTSEGYDSGMIAALMSYLGAVICVGKILCGQVYDRLGGVRGNYYIFGISLGGLGLCCLAPLGGNLLPFLALTLFGLGLPISAVPPARWSADLFPRKSYEKTVRSLTVAYTVGMLLFGPLPGALADWSGSYVPAYFLFAVFLAVAGLIVQEVYLHQPRRPRRIRLRLGRKGLAHIC